MTGKKLLSEIAAAICFVVVIVSMFVMLAVWS